MLNLLIVHYNTPFLTECLIKSINKFTPGCKIYIFDNSDSKPFTYRQDNIVYLDNTKGQYIDFEKWLEGYPNRVKSKEMTKQFGSAKHCYSVERCIDIIGKNFILLDSDILLKKDISVFNDDRYIFVGTVEKQPSVEVKRVLPFVCYINVDACKKNNVHYFDGYRMHGLANNLNVTNADQYDTGAAFYYHSKFFPHKEIDYRDYIEHFKGGSWENICSKRTIMKISSTEWLEKNKSLWKDTVAVQNNDKKSEDSVKKQANVEKKEDKAEVKEKKTRVLLCAIGKLENNYIREWVEHHKRLGFTNIVIYDNNDMDGEHFTSVINDYIGSGYVYLKDWRGVKLAQVPAYNDCYQAYKTQYDWICFWDIDEFIEFSKHKDIVEFLDDVKFKKTQCIRVSWKQYTDNGIMETNGDYSITKFTEVFDLNFCKKNGINPSLYMATNRQYKSMFRTNVENFKVTSPHCFISTIPAVDATGKPCKNDGVYIGNRPVWNTAWLNHYRFKTISEYVTNKMVRLWPTEYGNGGKDILNLSYFFKFNKETPEKLGLANKLLRKNKQITEKRTNEGVNDKEREQSKTITITSWVSRGQSGHLYHNNWGDELNFNLIPLMFNVKAVEYKHDNKENYAFIGSILNDLFIDENTIVWGAGTQDVNAKLTKKPKKICAVRGPLTRKFLMDSGIECPTIYGDPALLLPKYYNPNVEKKYKIGFIPHWESINSEEAIGFASKEGVHMIKVKGYKKWTDIVDDILSCECVVSESLHGLIIAEAYGIPNLWAKVTLDKYDIKFHDFFLSIGRDRTSPLVIKKNTPTQIIDVYIKSYKKGCIDLEPFINACPITKVPKAKTPIPVAVQAVKTEVKSDKPSNIVQPKSEVKSEEKRLNEKISRIMERRRKTIVKKNTNVIIDGAIF